MVHKLPSYQKTFFEKTTLILGRKIVVSPWLSVFSTVLLDNRDFPLYFFVSSGQFTGLTGWIFKSINSWKNQVMIKMNARFLWIFKSSWAEHCRLIRDPCFYSYNAYLTGSSPQIKLHTVFRFFEKKWPQEPVALEKLAKTTPLQLSSIFAIALFIKTSLVSSLSDEG